MTHCPRCRFEHDGTCTAARQQRRAGYIEAMRAELAAARESLCKHGAARCADCAAPARPPEPEEAAK